MNCGSDFKHQKSDLLQDAENPFTIFATVGAEAGVIASDAHAGIEEDFQQESSTMGMDDTELYDSSVDTDEPLFDNSEDFELDLSDADGPDSENWDIGATLTEDLSGIENVATEEPMNNDDFGTGDFEVQGLGFDLNTGNEGVNEESNSLPDSDYSVFADEAAAPEMEPYAGQNEIAFELTEDDSEPQVEGEAPSSEKSKQVEIPEEISLELDDLSVQDSEQSSDIKMDEISLETELKLEDEGSEAEQTTVIPEDLNAPALDENPTLNLEEFQLDLETDSMVINPVPADQSKAPESSLEGIELKMDSDEEPTPDH